VKRFGHVNALVALIYFKKLMSILLLCTWLCVVARKHFVHVTYFSGGERDHEQKNQIRCFSAVAEQYRGQLLKGAGRHHELARGMALAWVL
jgi:hypothetical protein